MRFLIRKVFRCSDRNFPQNAIKRVREGRLGSGMQFHPVNIIYLLYEAYSNFLQVSGSDACYVDYLPYARTVNVQAFTINLEIPEKSVLRRMSVTHTGRRKLYARVGN